MGQTIQDCIQMFKKPNHTGGGYRVDHVLCLWDIDNKQTVTQPHLEAALENARQGLTYQQKKYRMSCKQAKNSKTSVTDATFAHKKQCLKQDFFGF